MVSAGQMRETAREAGRNPYRIPPYKRGVTGSNPVAPTRFLQLGGLIETLIGGSVTTAGNHRCMLPDGGRVPKGIAASPSTTGARRTPTAGTIGTEAARRAEGSASAHAPCSSTIVGLGPGCSRCAVLVWADAAWLAEMSSPAMVTAAAVTMTRRRIRRAEEPRFIWPSFLKSVPGTDAEWAWDTATLRTLVRCPLGSHG